MNTNNLFRFLGANFLLKLTLFTMLIKLFSYRKCLCISETKCTTFQVLEKYLRHYGFPLTP